MDIVVHHLERSRSHRLLWLLEELGLDYELKTYERDPKTMRAPKSATSVHPRGRFPMLEIDGLVLAESGAIVEELLDRHPDAGLRPTDAEGLRRYRYFLHYAEGSLMSPLLVGLITGQLRGKNVPFLVRPIAKAIAGNVDAAYTTPELKAHVAFLEQELAEREYVAGDFSGADIQLSYPVAALLTRTSTEAGPKLRAYFERLEARPAYQAALAKGGPVML